MRHVCISRRLRKRPTALSDFVAWMESVWGHLDDTGAKRQQLAMVHEQLDVLHGKLKAVGGHCTRARMTACVHVGERKREGGRGGDRGRACVCG